MKFLNSEHQNTPISIYLTPYSRTYRKLEKPEIAFWSQTGSKVDMGMRPIQRHGDSITDHFDTQFGYINPQGSPETGPPFFGTKCSPAPPRDRLHFILLLLCSVFNAHSENIFSLYRKNFSQNTLILIYHSKNHAKVNFPEQKKKLMPAMYLYFKK